MFKNDKEEGAGEYIDSKDIKQVKRFKKSFVNDKIVKIETILSNGFKNVGIDIT